MSSLLLSGKELAVYLGRHASYVCAMKSFGFEFDYGNRCTLVHALAWIKANPTFRSTGYRRGDLRFIETRKGRSH